MIFGHVDVDGNAVNTHRDSYLLKQLSVVSVRRPLLPVALIFTGGLGAFVISFGDLLYPQEIQITLGACATTLVLGLTIGQLKLLSRDLRGSELSGVIWGSYARLNKVRREIVTAIRSSAPDGQTLSERRS